MASKGFGKAAAEREVARLKAKREAGEKTLVREDLTRFLMMEGWKTLPVTPRWTGKVQARAERTGWIVPETCITISGKGARSAASNLKDWVRKNLPDVPMGQDSPIVIAPTGRPFDPETRVAIYRVR